MNNRISVSLALLVTLCLFSCKEKKKVSSDPMQQDSFTIMQDKKTIADTGKQSKPAESITTPPVPQKKWINYYDQVNHVSLQYPSTWRREINRQVDFKILSPKESANDTILENFYYKVVQADPVNLLDKNHHEKTLPELAADMRINLTSEGPTRKNCKITRSGPSVLNGMEVFVFENEGLIQGVYMKYKIVLTQNLGKKYVLFYAAEARSYEKFLPEADMIFSSFAIR